jgi:hypothetical protein
MVLAVKIMPPGVSRPWHRKQADLPNRPEAIRRLVELGLKAKPKS